MFRHEMIFVVPGKGVKVPLPIPGTSIQVPGLGAKVERTLAVERLLRSRDLVIGEPPKAATPEPAAPRPVAPEPAVSDEAPTLAAPEPAAPVAGKK